MTSRGDVKPTLTTPVLSSSRNKSLEALKASPYSKYVKEYLKASNVASPTDLGRIKLPDVFKSEVSFSHPAEQVVSKL